MRSGTLHIAVSTGTEGRDEIREWQDLTRIVHKMSHSFCQKLSARSKLLEVLFPANVSESCTSTVLLFHLVLLRLQPPESN